MEATKENTREFVKKTTSGKLPAFTKDDLGGYEHIEIAQGVKLMMTDNANYCGGVNNGFGAGVYAIVSLCGMETSVKVA